MSLSVERVRHMLEVAKKERAESWDDMDEVGRSFSNDCVSAFDELIAIKEAEPVAEVCLNYLDDDRYKHDLDYSRSEIDSIAVGTQLIIKPE